MRGATRDRKTHDENGARRSYRGEELVRHAEGVEKSINWLVRVALTVVRVSDSVGERITCAENCNSSGLELSLGTS